MEDPPHLVRVCTGLPCRLTGAADRLRALEDRLRIKRGNTTPDHRVTLEETECLSVCALAPVLEVDGACHGRVTSTEVARLPMWFRGQRPSHAAVDVSDFPRIHAVGRTAQERLADLRSHAEARSRTRPELRFLVQGGSCGEALGAGEMIKALRLLVSMRGLEAEVLDGACHGMCAAGVLVEVQRTGWPWLTFTRLTRDAVPEFLSALVDDKPPLARFEGVAWNGEGWRSLPPASRSSFWAGQRRSIMERCGHLHPISLDDVLLSGGYSTFADVVDRQTPAHVIERVKASGSGELRTAAMQWEAFRTALAEAPGYFVMNGEEGAPGLFTDRHLLEGDPYRVLEGLLIAAYAAGATRGILHVNGAARWPFDRMARALAKAQAAGLIGDRVLGSVFSFPVELRPGARGFVRGEEQALLASIDGRQAPTRTKPPPPELRLWGKPALISNAETLAAIPPVIADSRHASHGRSVTKLFGVSGPVNCPGIAEVEHSVTLRKLLFEVAAGLRDGRALKGALAAGLSGVVLGPESLDTSLESLAAFSHGTRGVVPLPDGDSLAETSSAAS